MGTIKYGHFSDIILLTIILLVNTNLFDSIFLPSKFFVLSLVPIAYYTVKYHNLRLRFRWYIYIFFAFLLIDCMSSYYNRGQSVFQTVSTDMFLNLCSIFVYFYVAGKKISIGALESIILKLFAVFSIIYIIQYIIYPAQIVNFSDTTSDVMRFKLRGQVVLTIGYFLCLSRCWRTGSPFYFFGVCVALFIFLLLGYRSFLFFLFFLTFFFLRKLGMKMIHFFRLTVVIAIGLLFLSFTPIFQQRVNEFVTKQKTETFSNEDYVRVYELNFYLTEHFQNTSELLFGTGIPNYYSDYGLRYIYVKDDPLYRDNYVRAGWLDLGLFGLACIIGFFTVSVLLFLLYKAITLRQPLPMLYIPYLLVFLIVVSLATTEIYRPGSFIFIGILLYMSERGNEMLISRHL